jgi:hypothetical protein
MVVFTIVFGTLAKLPSEGVADPILVFAAMLPWQFFANALDKPCYTHSCEDRDDVSLVSLVNSLGVLLEYAAIPHVKAVGFLGDCCNV